MDTSVVRTTCPYCGVGCGVAASATGAIAGDRDHRANFGRLCSKGSALGDTLGMPGRLLFPQISGETATWDAALDLVAARFAGTIARYGPDAVAFYVSGQLLTEDYYVANKLMKGFIGSGNIDTNSRLCMASSVAGHRRAFGEDVVPGCYEDLEVADLVVLVGSNLAWCHPVLHRRLMDAREKRGTRIVVIDPRRTASCEGADLHLAIEPGTDVLLFNALLGYAAAVGATDTTFLTNSTSGFEAALDAAQCEASDLQRVAATCGISLGDLETFLSWFAATRRTVTVYSQGVNQSSRGTDKVNAIINCHLATGRIGKPGCGPFSITGQPNAMGGREVGGLANQLAAHMTFENAADVERVSRFWRAPDIARAPGLKAVDMFEAVGEGKIRAIWIMGTNPAVSLPNSSRVRAALTACDFVVVSECVEKTDTTAFAHVLLPAQSWGEKDGTVTNSDRTISRQRAFRRATGEARADWWAICELARRMGFSDAFSFAGPAQIFREHARLSAFENDGERVFNLAGLAHIDDEGYATLEPVQWPLPGKTTEGTKRLFADGRFATPSGRARFAAVRCEKPASRRSDRFPLILNTGRTRDQWHTMSQTGAIARLAAHASEPAAAISKVDAQALGVVSGDIVRIESERGTVMARASVIDGVTGGQVFLPMHWNDQFTANCVAGTLIPPHVDAISGQPELKCTPVRVERVEMRWSGFWVTRVPIAPDGISYWARIRIDGGYLYELAGPEASPEALQIWRAIAEHAAITVEYEDVRRGVFRWASIVEGTLDSVFLAGPTGSVPDREWLKSRFSGGGALDDAARATLLSGRPAIAEKRKGKTICSCFDVGSLAIAEAIRTHAMVDVKEIGRHLRAGTNCGSCIPELREMIAHESRMAAE